MADINIDASAYVKKTELPSNLTLYPTNVVSDIGGYFKMVTDVTDPDYNVTAVDITTPPISGTEIEIARLATTASVLLGNPGIINLTTIGNVRRISGSSNATFNYKIYLRDSGGVETLVATSNMTSNINVAIYEQFSAGAILNNGNWATTDRIVIVYYGTKVGGGSNSVFQFQFGGTNPVRTILPVPASVLLNVPIQNNVTKAVDFTSGSLLTNNGNEVTEIYPSDLPVSDDVQTALNAKQETLVSGTNIKTINGDTVLGVGNIVIESGITIDSTTITGGTDGRLFFQKLGKISQSIKLAWNDLLGILTVNGKIDINDGGNSVFLGTDAGLNDDATDNRNVGVGYQSLFSNTTGGNNTANGYQSLRSNTTGGNNTANGFRALYSNTTGGNNTANGLNSLYYNTTGNNNTANGYQSLFSNTTGNNNTANGFQSLFSNTTGNNNTATGRDSLQNNTTGGNNTANGYQSLRSNTTGNSNTANGFNSLFSNTTGDNNTATGFRAGRYIADGTTENTITNNSVYIGNNTKALADNQTNQIVIGHEATGNGSNTATIGDSNITALHVGGNGAGVVLKTPDGTKSYKISVDNTGNIIATLV